MRTISSLILTACVSVCLQAVAAAPAPIPRAVTTDPAPDAKFPARLEVIHVPTGGVAVNGVVYVAAGPGPHPTFVLFHGLPGNERNLDVAQAVRRAGWNAVTINYRGSWGSPGKFTLAQCLDDARATLAFVRDPANAKRLDIDPAHIAIGGHSLGGWVAAETLAADPKLLGAVLISAGDPGEIAAYARKDRATVVAAMNDSLEGLAGATGESMVNELGVHGTEWSFATVAPKLGKSRLDVLYATDMFEADSVALVKAVRKNGGKLVQSALVPTDHSWSDRRIELQTRVVEWLQGLPIH